MLILSFSFGVFDGVLNCYYNEVFVTKELTCRRLEGKEKGITCIVQQLHAEGKESETLD